MLHLIAYLDSQVADHLEHAKIFRGTSHIIQIELLDKIKNDMQGAQFISIQAGDATIYHVRHSVF